MKNFLLSAVLLAPCFAAAAPMDSVSFDDSKTKGSSSSETDATRLVDAASALLKKIEATKLNEAFKADFVRQLGEIMKAAKCREGSASMGAGAGKTGKGGAYECAAATPDTILPALEALDKLAAAVDKAVLTDGSKTLAEVYTEKIKELTKELGGSTLAAADKKAFETRIDDFTKKLKAGGGSKGSIGKGIGGAEMTPEEARSTFDGLKAEIKEAISLAAKGETLQQEYAKEAKALSEKIKTSVLAESFKADFERQLAAIDKDVCPAGTKGAGLGVKTGAAACGPVAAEAGLESLKDLSAAVDAAVKDDGSKTLSQIYGPKVDALKSKTAGAGMDAADKNRLDATLKTFEDALRGPMGAGMGEAKTGKPGMTPEKAESDYDELKAEVDAALKLAKTPGEFATTLAEHEKKLLEQIKSSKLNSELKAEFNSREADAVSSVKCVVHGAGMGAGKGSACKETFVEILEAETSLASLDKDLDKAIQKDGSKSMYALYETKITRLTDKLEASNVDATDKAKLKARIEKFAADLKDSDGGKRAKPFTAEDAEETFDQLKDDVSAAIDIAKSKH